MKKKLWRWIGRGLLLVFGILLVYHVWLFGHVLWWVVNPSTSAFMEQRLELLQEKNRRPWASEWVRYDKYP
jgi:monofunctional biosynthetic peptidoglycan transglycosylase